MSDDQPSRIAEPDDYKLIFEDNRVGQKIYEDLVQRFGVVRRRAEGIDRVLDTFEYQGRRQVIEFITRRINQSNGVEDNADVEV